MLHSACMICHLCHLCCFLRDYYFIWTIYNQKKLYSMKFEFSNIQQTPSVHEMWKRLNYQDWNLASVFDFWSNWWEDVILHIEDFLNLDTYSAIHSEALKKENSGGLTYLLMIYHWQGVCLMSGCGGAIFHEAGVHSTAMAHPSTTSLQYIDWKYRYIYIV